MQPDLSIGAKSATERPSKPNRRTTKASASKDSAPRLAPAHALLDLIGSAWKTQAIGFACQVGLFDHLAAGLNDPLQLAEATGTNQDALLRLLHSLVSLELLVVSPDGKFGVAPQGRFLLAGVPGSVRAMALLMTTPLAQGAWSDLGGSMRSGENFPQRAHGHDMFSYFRKHPDEGAVFNDAMTAITDVLAEQMSTLFDFSRVKEVADIGGGYGRLLAGILDANPEVTGRIQDLPEVLSGASAYLRSRGLHDRVELLPGDARRAIAPGADVLLMKNVLHMFDDATVGKILQHARDAVPAGGHLLILETVLAMAGRSIAQSQMDLTMLLLTQSGRERTKAEFQRLLEAHDFKLVDIKRTATLNELMIVEAV